MTSNPVLGDNEEILEEMNQMWVFIDVDNIISFILYYRAKMNTCVNLTL